MVQNCYAGKQGMDWDKTKKESYHFKSNDASHLFVLSQCVVLLLSMAVLYHVND